MKRKISLMAIATLLMLTAACKKSNETESNSGQQPEVSVPNDGVPRVQAPVDGKYPIMTFDHADHDFGTIQQGEKVVYDFAFTNTGEADLTIAAAKGSCGCTVPEYPKTPIKVGESGNIKVSFDSAGKTGKTTKTVTLLCNTKEGNKILTIKANIEVPKGAK